MGFRGNGQTLEFKVKLGLENAILLADLLKLVLKNSVKPDTNDYKSITLTIDKITKSAEGLRDKMKEAFKTSSGTRAFMKEYSQLGALIESIGERFGDVKLLNMLMPEADLKQLKDYEQLITSLEKSIGQLLNNKISDIFGANSDGIAGIEKIRSIIAELGGDVSKISFDLLGNKLTELFSETENKVKSLKDKIEEVNHLSQNFGGSNGGKLVESIKASTKDNVTNKLVDVDEIAKAKVALEEYYNLLADKGIAKKKIDIKSGSSISDIITKETDRIEQLYADLALRVKTGRELVENALSTITQTLTEKRLKGHGTTLSNDEINKLINKPDFNLQLKTALTSIGKDISSYDFSNNTQKVFNLLKADLKNGLEELSKATDIDATKQEIISKLKSVFEGLTTSEIIAPGLLDNFRRNIESELKKFNLDFDAIGFNAKTIKAGDEVASIYDLIALKIGECIKVRESEAATSQQELQTEEANLQLLKDAQEAFKQAKENTPTIIADKLSELENITLLMVLLALTWSLMTGKSIGDILNLDSLKAGLQALDGFLDGMVKIENRLKSLSNIQMAINRWMGFYQVLNLTKRAVNSMKLHITELDTVMTKIAVVTNMSQDNLWGQIGQYSEMARQYGVAIKGVYEVSQLYYQQGLLKGDVMTLTQETLKMARIAGIEYSTAADYMTTAIRGFKLEMSDAGHVTDVFSNLAANTASSTEELAVAISKTAASAASVGSSFESTSAMMATMISTTRESATNIGTALKSIISRYGEMKENMTGTDTEGEEYSLNKVDKALLSIGITLHDTNGLFRDFDDVILELAEAWDTIDKNTLRYIATVMAGNRQQSRFLSLVSNVDEYKRALEIANDAEGTGEIQTLKTLDSIDAKVERLKVTIQEFYTSSGIQDLYKGVLDTVTNVIDTANKLPKVFKNIPAAAMSIGILVVSTIKSVLTLIVASISLTIGELRGQSSSWLTGLSNRIRESIANGFNLGAKEGEARLKQTGKTSGLGAGAAVLMVGAGLKVAGSALTLAAMNQYALNKKSSEDLQTGWTMLGGAGAGVLGSAVSGAAFGGLPGAIIGGLTGIVTNLGSLSSAFLMLLPDATLRLKRERELSSKNLSEARQLESVDKGIVKEYETAKDKFVSLEEASHSSSEAMQEFIDYLNLLAESYPSLVDHLDEAGNSIITLTRLESELAKARQTSAASIIAGTENEIEDLKNRAATYNKLAKEVGDVKSYKYNSNIVADILGVNPNNWSGINAMATNFKQWAEVNLPNLKVDTGSLTTINFLLWQLRYQSALDLYYTEMINSPELTQNISDDTKLRIEGQKKQGLLSRYKLALENAITVDSDLTYAELTGQTDLKDLSEMDNWSLEKLLSTMQWTKDHAEQYIKSIVDNIGNLDDLLTLEKIDLKVLNEISKYSSTESETLNKYSSFVSNMIRRLNYKEKGEWFDSAEGIQAVTDGVQEWNEWLIKNEEDAEWLMKEFDFSLISGTKYGETSALGKISDLFAEHHIIDSNIIASYILDYETYVDNLRTGFNSAIDKYLNFDKSGLSNDDIKQFESLFDGQDTELTGELAKQVQSLLSLYKKIYKSGSTIDAANYALNLLSFYSSIAALEEDVDKLQVAEIIKDIDFSDSVKLDTIAKSLQEAGFNDLANLLTLASNTLGVNVAAQALSLSDSLKETVKDIEGVTEKIGKGMKFSDALESAKKILEKAGKDAEGLALTETDELAGLLAYDKSLGEYVLTTTAITTWISSLLKDSADQIEILNRSNTALKALLLSIKSAPVENIEDKDYTGIAALSTGMTGVNSQFYKNLQEQGYDLTKEEISLYAGLVLNLVEDFLDAKRAGSKLTWEEFVTDKQKILSENEKLDMEILASATKNSVLAQISSYDFSSIATGKAGQYSKSNLRALLEAAEIPLIDDDGNDLFELMYTLLLLGNFEQLNEMLTTAGGGLSDLIQDTTHEDIVSSYLDAIEYLTDESNNRLTIAIQKQIDAVKEKYNLDENASDTEVLSYMQKDMAQFLAWGWATLALVQKTQMDIIKKNLRDEGIGRSKAVLDAFKEGFTTDELNNLLENWGLQFFDDLNLLIEGLQEYFTIDLDTGDLKVAAGKSVEQALTALSTIYNLGLQKTSKLYKDTVTSEALKKIADLDAADIGKLAANTLSSIASAKAGTRLDVSGLPQELQDLLGANGDHIAEITSEYWRDSWILGLNINAIKDKEWQAIVRELLSLIKAKRNKGTALQSIMLSNVTRDVMKSSLTAIMGQDVSQWADTLLDNQAKNMGFVWDEYMQQYHATQKSIEWFDQLIAKAERDPLATSDYIENLRSLREAAASELNLNKKRDALTNLLSSYTDITSALAEFSILFGIKSEDLAQYYIESADGVKKLNVQKLKNDFADKFKESLGENWEELFDDTLSQITDSYLENISKASSFITQGTTNQAEMLNFIKNAKEVGISAKEAFSYDSILGAWTLSPEILLRYVLALAQALYDNGLLSEDLIIEYVNTNVVLKLAQAVDIKSFLDSEDKNGLARTKLAQQMKNFGVNKIGEALDTYIESVIKGIEEGGMYAVNALQTFAALSGKDLTSDEIESAYKVKISEIEKASELLSLGVGKLISGEAIEILTTANYKLTKLGNTNTAIINLVGDISAAYEAYYQALLSTNTATIESLNLAKAKVLETKDNRAMEQKAIDTLSDAKGMTYSTFGQLLSDMGYEMTDTLISELESSGITEAIGGNKMRIKDFSAFARRMDWDFNSEEYLSAFSSFNDSLVELNHKNKTRATDEITKLSDTKPGEWLNLTLTIDALLDWAKDNNKDFSKELQLSRKNLAKAMKIGDSSEIARYKKAIDEFSQKDYLTSLQEALVKVGATLTDGILRISENANLLGIAKTLSSAASVLGTDVSAQLLDMVLTITKSYSDAINKGITGGMTNVQMDDLIQKAKDMGVELNSDNFFRTAEGMLLTTLSAIELYNALEGTDTLSKRLVFKELSNALRTNNKQYLSATGILSHLVNLEKERNDLLEDGREKHEERIRQLELEIALAKEMHMASLMLDDLSWDFMSLDWIPANVDNLLRYVLSWSTAIDSLSTWALKGLIDINQFAALLHHVGEVADAAGESMTFMGRKVDSSSYLEFLDNLSKLIDYDSKGNAFLSAKALKTELGYNMSLGSAGISTELDTEIKNFMKNNSLAIKDLNNFYDGLKAGKASLTDVKNELREFDDFLTDNYFDFDKFTKQMSDKQKKAWDKFAENVYLGSEKLSDLMGDSKKNFQEGTANFESIRSLFKMMMSEGWDPEHDYLSIAEQLSLSGFTGNITIGDTEFVAERGTVYTKLKGKKGKGDKYYGPDGSGPYDDAESMWADYNQKQLDDFKNQVDKALGKEQEGGDNGPPAVTIDGKEYTIEVEGDHLIVKKDGVPLTGPDGKPYNTIAEAIASIKESITEELQEVFDLAKQEAGGEGEGKKPLDYMTAAGWNEYVTGGGDTYGHGREAKLGKLAYGLINSEVRSKLTEGGFTADSLSLRATELWEQSGLTGELAAAQFKIETGIDLDPSTVKEDIENIPWSEYIDQANMSLAAGDVMAGITAAFGNKDTAAIIGTTISGAVRDGLTNVDIEGVKSKIAEIKPEPITITVTPPDVTPVTDALKQIPESITVTVTPVLGGISGMILKLLGGFGKAAGNVSIPSGAAHAQSTLMGELGPEMVVSNSRYFVVGLNGPEFVDLADDAIVFNHILTRSLLQNGNSRTHGKPITNERKAVAYAHGSIFGGPAHGVEDMGGNDIDTETLYEKMKKRKKGGGDAEKAMEGLIKALDKWYNLLQELAKIQTKLNKEEALRAKIQSDLNKSGKEYYESLKRSIEQLKKELETSKLLVEELKAERDKRTKELKKAPFGKMYETDEDGQVKMKTKFKKEYDKYFDDTDTGKPKKTIKELYNWLKKQFGAKALEYDSNGKKIEFTGDETKDTAAMKTAVEAALKRMEAQKDEIQGLTDSINEHEKSMLEAQEKENELLQAMRDNLLTVEDSVLNAIISSREREIEDQLELRDAIEESTNKFIDGLSNALNKEREMYNMEEEESSLRSKLRRLAVLQRTGGSGSEIASLESEILSDQRDLYFDKQQEQIDAIQEASDKEIERLDMEIDLMQTQLDYEKEHGLLWDEVYEVMNKSAEEIANFIQVNDSDWWAKSAIATLKDLADAIFNSEQWVAYRDEGKDKQEEESGTDTGTEDKETTKVKGDKKAGDKTKYQVTYKDSKGKTKTRYFDTKKEAKEFLKQHEGSELSKYKKPKDTGTTVTPRNRPLTDAEKLADLERRRKEGEFLTSAELEELDQLVQREGERKRQLLLQQEAAELEKLRKKLEEEEKKKKLQEEKQGKVPGKAKGGYVTNGIYELGEEGTEAVLTAEQTSILKNKILANKPNSLINLLADFLATADKMANGSTYNSIDRSAATSIGSMAVNMNVKEIANDYDAKRAGELAMEEMLRIARKTNVTSLRR